MDDYEVEYDKPCPKCGNEFTHWRDCLTIGCEDGSIDLYEEDAINYMPGEEYELCSECYGTGIEWWCPKCGAHLNAPHNQPVEPTGEGSPKCICIAPQNPVYNCPIHGG